MPSRVSGQQLLNLAGIDPWAAIPSPKIRRGDIEGVYSWAPLYAGFSERFAIEAIRLLAHGKQDPIVLDPFVGGGTTAVAAARLGLPAIGVDLDPFSALLSRARVATRASSGKVQRLLAGSNDRPSRPFSQEASVLFRPSDLRFASSVINTTARSLSRTATAFTFDRMLGDAIGDFDSEVVALAALCIASSSSAKLVRGSNPVWFRKALPGERDRPTALATATRSVARRMLADLQQLKFQARTRSVRIIREDFRATCLEPGCADVLLTSPPYLNRLDYVINHLAPISLLTGVLEDISVEAMRRQMVGTTKIKAHGKLSPAWGRTCLSFLESVAHHPSKASKTYYYWTYFQYFSDLFEVLESIRGSMRSGAVGAMVVQNSFYKQIAIPVSTILIEMCSSLDIRAGVVRSEAVRGHMGTMSPRQTQYVRRKVLQENVVGLMF